MVVVGAGAIGLACAWRAAQAGLRVRVLERDEPGAGASGAAAGMLAPVGEATWGEERLLEAAVASHAMWPGFAAELTEASGADTALMAGGALHVGLDADEAAELRRRFKLMKALELEAEWLSGSDCRALEPGLATSVVGGVNAPHEHGVDPGALVRALTAACTRAGVGIETGVEATAAIVDGERFLGIIAADGRRHEAKHTVLAAGAWSGAGWLPAPARPVVRPVKGQILTLRGPADRPVAERIVVCERVYLVPRADGRVIAGATVEEMGFDTRVTAGGVHELLREAYRTLPEIAELELERVVAGLRPGTLDNAPLIGPAGMPGLVLATGHFRNGILLAPLTATGVVAVLAGEELPAPLAVADPARFEAGLMRAE
ncbi:MAG: glycine oxidase ThiO [Actinomycetota bacterium]|nr:glycine oxidase ThiO [Actinomycetota bacterium]